MNVGISKKKKFFIFLFFSFLIFFSFFIAKEKRKIHTFTAQQQHNRMFLLAIGKKQNAPVLLASVLDAIPQTTEHVIAIAAL